jgi:predicted dehydrogenase
MSGALSVALVGCGRIGAHTTEAMRSAAAPGWLPVNHAEAIRSTPGLALAGVCDADRGRAQATGEELGVPWFTDYRDMLGKLKPALLSIATRTEGRCDMVEFAAKHGVRGVHVEKPLGRSPAECRRALAAAQAAGLALTYGTTRRWMPAYRLAHRLALEDGLEDLVIEMGRGELLWTHPHSFDLMVWFSGTRAVESVQANCSFEPGALQGRLLDADPMVESASVRFAGGLHAAITSTPGKHLRARGARGAVSVEANGTRVMRAPAGGAPQPVAFDIERSGTQQAFLELALAVRDGASSGITTSEILLSNRLGFACAWSAIQGGRRVRLDEVPEDFTITGRQGPNYA